MVKNILVPIDFHVASLNTLKLGLAHCKGEKVKAVLMYAQHLDDSITELMFYSPKKIIRSLLSPEFNQALEILRNHFEGSLQEVAIELFHGNNKSFLNNFLHAHKIQEIFIPKTYELKKAKRAFDPLPLLKSTNTKLTELDWNANYNKTEQEQITALFN